MKVKKSNKDPIFEQVKKFEKISKYTIHKNILLEKSFKSKTKCVYNYLMKVKKTLNTVMLNFENIKTTNEQKNIDKIISSMKSTSNKLNELTLLPQGSALPNEKAEYVIKMMDIIEELRVLFNKIIYKELETANKRKFEKYNVYTNYITLVEECKNILFSNKSIIKTRSNAKITKFNMKINEYIKSVLDSYKKMLADFLPMLKESQVNIKAIVLNADPRGSANSIKNNVNDINTLDDLYGLINEIISTSEKENDPKLRAQLFNFLHTYATIFCKLAMQTSLPLLDFKKYINSKDPKEIPRLTLQLKEIKNKTFYYADEFSKEWEENGINLKTDEEIKESATMLSQLTDDEKLTKLTQTINNQLKKIENLIKEQESLVQKYSGTIKLVEQLSHQPLAIKA